MTIEVRGGSGTILSACCLATTSIACVFNTQCCPGTTPTACTGGPACVC
ncbi:MAG: hypothetical protein GY940_18825 [bacterium]|nr:hypothetical protein [bacterium]